LALVLSLGGKLLLDRATRPRYWLKAAPVDPELPIRGRYVSLRVEVPVTGAEMPPFQEKPADWPSDSPWPPPWQREALRVDLEPTPQGLRARALPKPKQDFAGEAHDAYLPERYRGAPSGTWTVELREALPFFIPEHVPDPSNRPAGEELWVEVTLPRKGPLRPIRLGVMKNGTLTPLAL
jgi:hypothetical protein